MGDQPCENGLRRRVVPNPDLLAGMTFLVIAASTFSCFRLFGAKPQALPPVPLPPGARARPTSTPWRVALASVLPQSASRTLTLERDLKRAGYYRSTAVTEYLALRNGLVLGILIATPALALVPDPGTPWPNRLLCAGALLAGVVYALPRLMLTAQATARVERIQRGLPDAFDIITMCLTGGLPLRSALHRVADQIRFSHPEIALEFDIIHKQADAESIAKALKQFARRLDVPDINALASLITQTERLGTNVAGAVIEYADSVRQAHRQRAEERAGKTSIKMLFPIIFCLAPPFYVLMAGPPILKIRDFLLKENRPGGALNQAFEFSSRNFNSQSGNGN
jgi:tight adherence protein C